MGASLDDGTGIEHATIDAHCAAEATATSKVDRVAAPTGGGSACSILDGHTERGADAGERIDHKRDQRAIAQAGMRPDIDAIQQRACFCRIEHRRFARTSRRAAAHALSRPDS